MLKSGDLKYRIEFLSLQKVKGKYGTEEQFTTLASGRCSFKQTATKGRIVDGQEITTNRYLIKMRKRLDVDESMKVKVKDLIIDITGILQEERETHIYGTVLK